MAHRVAGEVTWFGGRKFGFIESRELNRSAWSRTTGSADVMDLKIADQLDSMLRKGME